MDRNALPIDPHYREELEGVLSFSSFADAEETIKRLDNLCRQYRSVSDKKGVDYCRQIASMGRRRAELISSNKRVNPQKRLQKQEIANWFKIWLETPDIFPDWLEMRKKADEFQRLLESESVRESKSGE